MTNEKAPERIYMHPTSAEASINPWPLEQGEYVEYVRSDLVSPASAAPVDWKPIGTAPQDGRTILVARERVDAVSVRWMVSHAKSAPDGAWFVGGYDGPRLRWEPTHWISIPALHAAAATAAPQQSEHKILHYFTPSERGDTCFICQRGVLEHPETPKHNIAAAPVEQSDQSNSLPTEIAAIAEKVAVEIANNRLGPRSDSPQFWDKYTAYVKGIVMHHFASAPMRQSNKQEVISGLRAAVIRLDTPHVGEQGNLWTQAIEAVIRTIDRIATNEGAR